MLVCYSVFVAVGDDSATRLPLADGMVYERLKVDDAVVHLATIDLASDCVSLHTSNVNPDGTSEALKTVTWARQEGMVAAINASFFYPYDQSRFWDVYPAEGESVTVLGPVIHPGGNGGLAVAHGPVDWAGQVIALDGANRPSISESVPTNAVLAVSGRQRILQDGDVVAPDSVAYPRTVVGIDAEAMTMWWLVADGNQPGYSPGMTLKAAARFLQTLGATDGLELDGGGSSTMVIDDGSGAERASRTMQIRIPGRSRAVANHLGVASRAGTDGSSADGSAC